MGASIKGKVGKTSHLLALNVNISKTVGDTAKLLLMTNRKSYIRIRLTPRSMTLDVLEVEPCADVSISAAARRVILTGGGGAPIDFFRRRRRQ